jgi:Sec-independent protein translocase protein TatA
MIQMITDLIIVVVVVRLIFGAASRGAAIINQTGGVNPDD